MSMDIKEHLVAVGRKIFPVRKVHLVPFEVPLKSGEQILVRDVGPDDRDLLKHGFQHLSKKSRHFRFLSAHPNLTPSEIEQFTSFNSQEHVAIGALSQGGSEPVPLGIARYVRLAGSDGVAEVAITIADSHQGLGLGSLLLGVLAKYAVHNGISEFNALVLRENTAMLGLFSKIGCGELRLDEPEVEASIPLFLDPADYPKTSVGDVFRASYGLTHLAEQSSEAGNV